ncbi:putative trypsin [Trichinella spiralis]|uniref:putative trypsin n=1 Tax=Trichinella spiralis TaxID=6334 RepID=UPI0001EFC7E9|nr:putative trypsin [Trichinella spiralis]
MHRFSLSIILHVTNWIAIYEAIHIPCGKATAKRLEAVPRVGYPPNFKKVMAVPKSMPWNVIVQADVTMCGGVLIRLNDDFNYTDTVLTSSQCFFKNFNERVDHANVKVHLGAHKLPISRDTLTVGVKHVTTTPFTENDYHKDLAVVTLHGNVEISEKIRPICLPEKDVEFTTPAILCRIESERNFLRELIFRVDNECGVEKFPQRKLYYLMPNETNVEENIRDYVHALPHSFPWSVIIKSKNRTCGGALVAMPYSYLYGEHVLTAAQCFLDKNDKYINHDNYEVILGAHILSRRREQMVVGIKQVTLSAFDRSTMGPDFALITLETTVRFNDRIQPICLPVDIGSILSAETANQSFLYGLFSGHLSSSSAENDIFLFNRIQYSTEWLLRSADPAFSTFIDISRLNQTNQKMLKINITVFITLFIAYSAVTKELCGESYVEPRREYTVSNASTITKHLTARPHSYPWSVALISKYRTCGGVLIMLSTNIHGSELVITSAQCFINSTGHRIDHTHFEVVLGAHDMKSKHSALILGIKYVTIAELENYRMIRDLALVTLQTQVLFSKTIQPVCIPEPDIPMYTGDVLPLLGWNLIDIRVLPKELCEEVIPAFNIEHHVCGRFADRYLYKAKVTVDIGSALLLSSAGRVFLYALFSGHYTRNFTNDLLLFYKIETSIEWMARSANPMIMDDNIVVLSVNPISYNV